jgi:capsid protein
MITNAHQGASANRLQGGWLGTDPDADDLWIYDANELATRSADAVRNDVVIAALLAAKTMGEQGARGLKFRSLVELDGNKGATSTAETDLRQQIETEISEASEGRSLDAAGMMTRREFEIGLSEQAAIRGESFAVKCYLPGRAWSYGATCWRFLRRDRVCNPPGMNDSDRLYQGFALDVNGAPTGIWVRPPQRLGVYSYKKSDWKFVPWYDDNGVACVIHRIGKRVPGSYRGLSMFSPLLYLATQVKKMIDAYVVAKRIQACHPIFIKCEDPAGAAKKDRNGAVWGPNTTLEPGKVYYVGPDAEMFFPSWAFNGQDMQAFLDTLYRNQFAAWGLPIDVVLAQLGKTNMAASRSAWLQFYRQCEKWQDDHIEQVSSILDANIIQEALLSGRIIAPQGMTLRELMKGRYVRPARSMPDPLKEANAVQAWKDLGRDLTGLFGESGVDFRDSIAQREEDDRWLESHDVQIETPQNSAAAVFESPTSTNPQEPQDEPATEPTAEPDAGTPEDAP